MKLQVHPRTGRIVSGVGTGRLALDNRQLTDLFGGQPGWLDETHIICSATAGAGAPWFIYEIDLGVTPPGVAPILSGEGQELCAGGGRWARWIGGNGPRAGLLDNMGFGFADPEAPLEAREKAARERKGGLLDVGPDGTLYYTTDRQVGRGVRARTIEGDDLELLSETFNTPLCLRGASGKRAIWSTYDCRFGPGWNIPQPVGVPGELVFEPSLVDAPDGEMWISYGTANRILAHPIGDWRRGHSIPRQGSSNSLFFSHAAEFAGQMRLAWSTTQGARPGNQRFVDLPFAPEDDLFCLPSPAPRPLYAGWFTFGAHARLPGNVDLPVGPSGDYIVRAFDGRAIAAYCEGTPDGDPAAIERAIKSRRAATGLPVLAYWPASLHLSGPVPTSEYVSVEANQKKGEAIGVFKSRIKAAIRRCGAVFVSAQCYTSNADLATELTVMAAIASEFCRDCPNVKGVLVFSGAGRQTGLQDHPEALAPWTVFFESIVLPKEEEPVLSPKVHITRFDGLLPAAMHAKDWTVEWDNTRGESTRLWIDKDGRLWIRIKNAAGEDTTGQVRQAY